MLMLKNGCEMLTLELKKVGHKIYLGWVNKTMACLGTAHFAKTPVIQHTCLI